jgi:hypothetical protein
MNVTEMLNDVCEEEVVAVSSLIVYLLNKRTHLEWVVNSGQPPRYSVIPHAESKVA